MKYIISLLVITFIIGGCSFDVVPPASKGKILTTAGYELDVLEPGKYTTWFRDQMVILDTSTTTYKERVDVVLADKLTLNADIRFRGRISGSKKVINGMFNDIRVDEDANGGMILSFSKVYETYGRMVIRNKTREVISQYNVEDVHKNYSRLSKQIGVAVLKALEGTPLEISDISLGRIAYPKVVTDAINSAKERDLAIKKEEAQAKIMLVKKKNERALAEADYQVQITRAKAIRDKNKIIGEGVTKELIDLRRLEVLEKMAENKSAVFMPVEAMTSIGAQIRMFQK